MKPSRSFVIDIPTPRVCAKESNIRIRESELQSRLRGVIKMKPRKCSKELSKFAFPTKPIVKSDVIKREGVCLLYKLFFKEHDKMKYRHQLKVTLQQKYKMVLSEYRSRLYVEEPTDEVKAVTDIDKGFFNYINGRHVTDRAPVFKTLKTIITDMLRTKLEVSYRNDQMLNIDVNLRKEMKIFEQSVKLYHTQTKHLDSFISEDYRKSIDLLKICKESEQKLTRKLAEIQILADRQVTIVSHLIGLDYMYYLQQSYGRFLYYLSPPTWRAKNRKFAKSIEIEAMGFDLSGSDVEETFNVIFDKMKKECLTDPVSPVLYFSEPHELLRLFEGIEKQQSNYLDYVTHLAPLLKQAKGDLIVLKDIITQDCSLVLNTINTLKAVVTFSEEQCALLEKKFYQIINGLFYESVGAPQVIKLNIELEFCYEKLYSEKPMNLDIFTLAKDLEAFYMYYWKNLDAILSGKNEIGKAVKKCEETERKKFKRAINAKRQLCEFKRLKIRLLSAFAPPCPGSRSSKPSANSQMLKVNKSVLPKKLNKKHSRKDVKKSNNLNLSDSQLEYLELFTNWTCDEDPLKYLHFVSADEIKIN